MTVGEFIFKVGFHTDQTEKRKAEGEIQDLSSTAKKLLGAIGIGFSIKGTFDAIKSCVSASSAAEEMENKFNVVFQGINEEVDAWAQNYADKVNRNKNSIKTYLADQQNLLVGFGMTREAGAELSKQMTTLALDLASFGNLDEDMAVENLTKAVMGESEAAKSLGAVLSDTTREQAMMNMGLSGTYESLDQLTKMQVNYNAILSQSGDAVGDCERSLDSYASTAKGFQAKLIEIKELVGKFFMPTFKKVLSYGTIGLLKLRDIITRLQEFADRLGGADRLLRLIAISAAGVMIALNFNKIIGGIKAALKLFNLANLKIMAIVAAVVLLVLLVDDFINFLQGNNSVIGTMLEKAGVDVDGFREKVLTVWNTIKTTLVAIWGFIKGVALNIWDGLKAFWDENGESVMANLLSIWTSIKSILSSVWEGIKSVALSVFEALKSFWDTWGEGIMAGFSTTWEGIKSLFTIVLGIITNLFSAFAALFSGDWGALWDSIKAVLQGIWDGIVTILTTVLDTLWAIFGDKITAIKDTIVDGFTAAIDWIKSLPEQAVQWGSDIIKGIVNGIKGAVGWVGDAVKGVANKIKSFLGFSEPEDGPLSDFHTYMPDMMQLMADGIKRNKDLVVGAVDKLAGDIQMHVDGGDGHKGTPQTGPRPRTIATAVSNSNSTRTINQINNFNNHFEGGEREQQKRMSKAAKSQANDTSAELARALAFT